MMKANNLYNALAAICATARVLQSPSGANNNYPKSRSISSVTENYLIYMDMTTSALIPSGSYNFKTTLTATY
ncbi:MAG: hypothetical protein ACK510_00105 [bacterium]